MKYTEYSDILLHYPYPLTYYFNRPISHLNNTFICAKQIRLKVVRKLS